MIVCGLYTSSLIGDDRVRHLPYLMFIYPTKQCRDGDIVVNDLGEIVISSNARTMIEKRLNELKIEREYLNRKIENIENGLRVGY